MWDPRYLKRIDFRTVPIVIALMIISILVIVATTSVVHGVQDEIVLSSMVKNQIRAFGLGIFVYLFLICFDYRKLREWTWFFYLGIILLLFGLFFAPPIHNVRRWYRFPFLPFDIQPSEYAKLVVVIALSWFLEKKMHLVKSWKTFLEAALIVFVPFVLILKQPDLGTALILGPIALVIFYFGGVKKGIIKGLMILSAILFSFILLVFLGILSHDEMRPFFTKFMKEYQYERLNPNTYHQIAGQTAIALGKMTGSGFCKSEFTGHNWLPYAYTDSVFPAFTEEFGLMGAFFLLALFFGLIYFSFQVTHVARDHFGRLLASGIAVYLAMHVIINMGMMCGFLPITGVPLVLVSYGGSSVLSTMIALGLLQSIYARRFAFS
jgi:rod shape determining protein RodA